MVKKIACFLFIIGTFIPLKAQRVKLNIPLGHTYDIHKIRFSASGKFLLSISEDQSVKIWSIKTGYPIKTFYFKDNCHDALFAQNDSILIVAAGNKIFGYDLYTENEIYKLVGDKEGILSLSLHQKTNLLTASSLDKVVRVWDIKTRKLLRIISGFPDWVNTTEVDPSGTICISPVQNKDDNKTSGIYVHDVTNGKMNLFFPSYAMGESSIMYTSDNRFAYIIYDFSRTIFRYDLKKNYMDTLIHFDRNSTDVSLWGAATLCGDTLIYLSEFKGKLSSYNIKTGAYKMLMEYPAPNTWEKAKITSIASSGKDILLGISLGNQKLIQLVDLKSNEIVTSLTGMSDMIKRIHPNDPGGFLTSSNEKCYKYWNINSGKMVKRVEMNSGGVASFAISPDKKWLLTGGKDPIVKLWDFQRDTCMKIFKGHEGYYVMSVLFTSDSTFLSAGYDKKIMGWNVNRDSAMYVLEDTYGEITRIDLTNDKKYVYASSNDRQIKKWDLKQKKIVQRYKAHEGYVYDFCKSSDDKFLYSVSDDGFMISWIAATGAIRWKVKTGDFVTTAIDISANNKLLVTCGTSMNVNVWDAATGKLLKTLKGHKYILEAVSFINNDQAVLSAGWDNTIKLWDLKSGLIKADFINLLDGQWMTVTPDNYYMCSKNILSSVGFTIGMESYSPEQFDLKYNRPDIVLKTIGSNDTTLIRFYHNAYLKRLKKMNFTEQMLQDDYSLPKIKITNFEQLQSITDSSLLNLDLEIEDSKYKIDRINIYINDVAIYGTTGINLRKNNVSEVKYQAQVKLLQGQNKIQVSVLNQAGAESLKETVYVTYKPKETAKPDLYLITIGDSKYKDARFDLNYASKDAEDIASGFKDNALYQNIFTYTYTNEKVTKENILKLKEELKKARRDDVVIITVAGHGVLDKDLNYYLATYDMDFNNPSAKGLPYEELESLVDGIAPLKKVILLDACHSGEVDKEEVEQLAMANTNSGEVKFRAAGAGIQKKNLGLKTTSELMGELFTDLRRGTGATVISSAGGVEYAMESDEWKNGLFTYCLLHGLKDKVADANKDGQIMLSELQQYLRTQVTKLSNGAQQPTSRIENLTMDFRIW